MSTRPKQFLKPRSHFLLLIKGNMEMIFIHTLWTLLRKIFQYQTQLFIRNIILLAEPILSRCAKSRNFDNHMYSYYFFNIDIMRILVLFRNELCHKSCTKLDNAINRNDIDGEIMKLLHKSLRKRNFKEIFIIIFSLPEMRHLIR